MTNVRGFSQVGAGQGNSACTSGSATFVNRRLTTVVSELRAIILPMSSPTCFVRP